MVRVLDIYLVYYEWQCLILFTQYIIIYKYHPPSAIQGISKFPLLAPQFAWLSPTRTPTSSRPNSSPVPVASLNKSFSLVTPRWSFNWLLNHWMIFYGWNIRSNPVAWNMTKTSKASTTNQGNFSCFPFYAPPPLSKKKDMFFLGKKILSETQFERDWIYPRLWFTVRVLPPLLPSMAPWAPKLWWFLIVIAHSIHVECIFTSKNNQM